MPTYTPLQSIQLASSSASVIFSNIPQNYEDLIIVLSVRGTTATNDIDVSATVNGDTSSVYSNTRIYATGSAAASQRGTGLAYLRLGNMTGSASYNTYTPITLNIQNYSNTTTFKTTIGRSNNPDRIIDFYINLWRSTSAINSITITGSSNFDAGCTFDLYGVSPIAAQTAQAAGGTDIYYDSSYVYHVFKGSGTFTPYRNLTCDYLVVAGGGGGGRALGGGGGAGGYKTSLESSSISVTSGVAYTITVGSGGSGGLGIVNATNGANSSISGSGLTTITSDGGGGGASYANNGSSGGSGGGAGWDAGYTPGTGISGQGFAGGNAIVSTYRQGGGGGGAGAVGGNASGTTLVGASGGIGKTNAILNAISYGQLSSGNYYVAGGGGGSLNGTGTAGTGGVGGGGSGNASQSAEPSGGRTNFGGGGGASWDNNQGGNGGSGLVIVRYAR